MAVPTGNNIKLSDVCSEIYGSAATSGKSLLGCHTDATGTFDGTYAVTGDTLMDFRGYTHVVSYVIPQNSVDSWTSTPISNYTTRVTNDGGSIDNSTWLGSDLSVLTQTQFNNDINNIFSAGGGRNTSGLVYILTPDNSDLGDTTPSNLDLNATAYGRPSYRAEWGSALNFDVSSTLKADSAMYINMGIDLSASKTYVIEMDSTDANSVIEIGLKSTDIIFCSTNGGATYFERSVTDPIQRKNLKLLVNLFYDTNQVAFYLNGSHLGTGTRTGAEFTNFKSITGTVSGTNGFAGDLYSIIEFNKTVSSTVANTLTTQ